MNLSDLPDPADPAAVFEFAMSFNGYEYFGSFEACAEAAASRDRSTIELLRNKLFFAARTARHRGDAEFMALYHDLLPALLLQLRDIGSM